jgi:two-component system, NarL family, nitrate/nitrite response regulator NarL
MQLARKVNHHRWPTAIAVLLARNNCEYWPSASASCMPKTVLIADDNPSIRFLIRSLVESADFTVCAEAANGTETIEKASQFHPDLILLDLAMPLMNGAEAASILKKQMPQIPIILFTIHEDSVSRTLASRMGVARVIGKPDGMTKLLQAMRDVLALPPQESPPIGPLRISAEGPKNGTHPAPPAKPTEEEPPE